ncbi:hypothetical protein C0J52_12617 [Blattella germanica]|nr:hypothetical protein C0J52_12617 [Blattella germanica]
MPGPPGNVANYLILSLAVADLLVACLVMPLGAVYEVSKEWTLGPELCDMWTSSDVLSTVAQVTELEMGRPYSKKHRTLDQNSNSLGPKRKGEGIRKAKNEMGGRIEEERWQHLDQNCKEQRRPEGP